MITPPMEPFCAGERVKGMVLGALVGEFPSPLEGFGNSHVAMKLVTKCRLPTTK